MNEDDSLKRLINMAELLLRQRATIESLEGALDEAKAFERQLAQIDLPNLMVELGVSDFRLESGQRVSVSRDITTNIPLHRRQEAFAWLEEHGYGGIIKSSVTVEFGRKEINEARRLQDHLSQEGLSAELKEEVHHSTLKAFVKERLADPEATEEFPVDLFNVNEFNKTIVK